MAELVADTLMFAMRSPPSGQMKYGHDLPAWVWFDLCGQYRLPRAALYLPPA